MVLDLADTVHGTCVRYFLLPILIQKPTPEVGVGFRPEASLIQSEGMAATNPRIALTLVSLSAYAANCSSRGSPSR